MEERWLASLKVEGQAAIRAGSNDVFNVPFSDALSNPWAWRPSRTTNAAFSPDLLGLKPCRMKRQLALAA